MLVYYSRRYNSRQSSNTQSHYTSLDDIMDTTDMTDDQLQQEYETLREQMLTSIELQYISDTEPQRNLKITRTYSRVGHKSHNPREQEDLLQATQQDDPTMYDFISDEDSNEVAQGDTIQNEDIEPTLPRLQH